MQPNLDNLWEICLQNIGLSIDQDQYNTWVRPLQAVEEGGVLKILAPNPYALDWAKQNISDHIEEALKNSNKGFVFEVGGNSQDRRRCSKNHRKRKNLRNIIFFKF